MDASRKGQIAVIFTSRRTPEDAAGYDAAARRMEELAALQPGYRGLESVRGADGLGITISWWESEEAARAWRDHPEHAAVREQGRALWYESYEIAVTRAERDYRWQR